jgi:hypothetical protein
LILKIAAAATDFTDGADDRSLADLGLPTWQVNQFYEGIFPQLSASVQSVPSVAKLNCGI